MANKTRLYIRRLVTILVCLALIAFFSWVEHNSGTFEWWHVWVLLGVVVLAVIASLGIPKKLWSWLNNIKNLVLKYVGFDKESWEEGRGVRREYFMALVPISFIISAYLMQTASKGIQIDIAPFILSIVMLICALNLVAVSFARRASIKWVKITSDYASWIAVLGSLVFAHDIFIAIGDLIGINANPIFVGVFLVSGMIGVFAIVLFFFISTFGRELVGEKG